MNTWWCRTAVLVCGLASAAGAGIAEVGASKDNTLYETPDGSQSNGAGWHCFVGITGEPLTRRTLMAFDVGSAVPAGATILECSLTLHMSKTIAGATDVTVHRVLSHWGEGGSDAPGEEGVGAPPEPGDATWIHTEYDTYYWGRSGGDFEPTPSATTEVARNGHYTWRSAGLAADAQAWLDGSHPNYGWLLAGDESQSITAKRFDTRENPDPSVRPVLRIVYVPACIADWDSNGVVNTLDVLGFLNEWAAQEVSADLNWSGNVDVMDMLLFLNEWVSGCA